MSDVDSLNDVPLTSAIPLRPREALGPYVLLDKVGFGAFGDVWRAEHTETGRVAAIKVFSPERFSVDERRAAAERFRDGTKAMQKLERKPGVIQLYEGPTVSTNHLWFAMEYFPQKDLDRWIKQHPETSYEERLRLINDVVMALEAAHREGVVHRDVRPGNILISDRGSSPQAVLADFDIAYFEDFLRKREETASIVGWPRYLPPDVFGATGDEIARKLRRPGNDLYALSIVAFDLLSDGRPSIPEKVTSGTLFRLFPKRAPQTPYGLPPATRWRLANFFAVALQRSAPSFDSVAAFRLAWESALTSTRSLLPLLVAAILVFVAGLVAFDWAHDKYADNEAARALTVGVTALLEVGVLGFVGKLVGTLVSGTIPPWKQRVAALRAGHPVLFPVASLAVAAAAACVLFACWPSHRARAAHVSSAQGCLGVDGQGAVGAWITSPDREEIDTHKVRSIRCHPATQPKIVRRSFLTPPVELERSAMPSGAITASWKSPTTLVAVIGGSERELSLAGVRVFSETHATVPPVPSSGVSRVEVPNPIRPTSVVVRRGEDDLGATLLAAGLLRVSAERHPPVEYVGIESQARTEERGNWGTLASMRRRAELLKACPEACCDGIPCEERADCVSRWACILCRDGEIATWKVRLDGVDLADSDKWNNVKVCISVGDETGQNCVLGRDAGTPLGVFEGEYNSRKARNMHFVVVGTNLAGIEQRLGQRTTSWKMTAQNLCSPRRVRDFEDRNGSVDAVRFATLAPVVDERK